MSTATLTDQSTQTDRMESPKLPETRGPLSNLEPPIVNAGISESAPESEVTAEDESFEKTLHKCFNRVAIGNAAMLSDLLREANRNGLSLVDVREHLADVQANSVCDRLGNYDYSIWRSFSGIAYITCETWRGSETVVSVNEIFAELNEQKPQTTYSPKPGHLSKKLRGLGEELTELEACILDAAQTLNKKFQHGIATERRTIGRVVMQYHHNLGSYDDLKKAFDALNNRGICRIENEQIRLLKSVERKPSRDESRFARLVSDERSIEILAACHACCGIAFDSGRNVSARAAVLALVQARHGISKPVFGKRVRKLIELGILEEVQSKGTTAFRLTIEATEKLKVRKPKLGAKRRAVGLRAMILERYSDAKARAILITRGEELSPLGAALACAVSADFDIDQIELGYLWKTFERQGFSFQEFRRAVGELVACGRACLLEAITDGKAVCHLELINDHNKNECVPITVAMETIEKPDSAATAV